MLPAPSSSSSDRAPSLALALAFTLALMPGGFPSRAAAGLDAAWTGGIAVRGSLRLPPGYQVKAKPGSMVAMDASVQIKGKLKVSFKKMFTGGEVRPSSLSVPCSFPFPLPYSLFVSLRGFSVRDGRTRADAGGR